jgi:hypothetical protein
MYKLIKDQRFETINVVERLSDNAFIPFDPANTDAKEFALWLQEGNKPEPAEEGGVVTDEWVAETIAKLLP